MANKYLRNVQNKKDIKGNVTKKYCNMITEPSKVKYVVSPIIVCKNQLNHLTVYRKIMI